MHPRHRLPIFLALALCASGAGAITGPMAKHPEVQLRLVSGWNVAPATREIWLGVEFRLAPGWHAYWKNPGDAGYAPRFDWSSRPAALGFDVLWPAPSRFLLPGDLQALGYADAVIYPVRVRFPSVVDGAVKIEARVDYLVCSDTCIPYRDALQLEMPAGAAARRDEATARRLQAWTQRVPVPVQDGDPFAAAFEIDGESLTVRFGALPAGAATPQLFFMTHPLFNLGPPARRPGDRLSFAVPIRRKDRTHPLPPTTTFDWTLTGVSTAGRDAVEGVATVALSTGDGEPKQ